MSASTRATEHVISDHCPVWCWDRAAGSGAATGAGHPDEPHTAHIGGVTGPSVTTSFTVELHCSNMDGLMHGAASFAEPDVRLGTHEDDSPFLHLTPAQARSVARLLTLAADALEVTPAVAR